MAKELLRLTNVSKVYRMGHPFTALHDISLSISEGEFIAITGPSGSGKSTLMHLIGCLDHPTTGSIILEGTDITRASTVKLAELRNVHIGFVFQQFHLLRKTSSLANVELPLIYRAVSGTERKRRAIASLAGVGLGDKLHNYPSQLSGGEQQRVAIARALVTNPKILLADEPTGNLDSKSGHDILALFQAFHKAGRTVILVTHDQSVAAVAKRQIRITDGMVVSDTRKK